MCFADGARPPIPSRGTVYATDVALRTHDGQVTAAYAAIADNPADLSVVVLPDVRGMHEYYKNLARCLAVLGADAITLDYYSRTAGTAARTGDFDHFHHRDLVSALDLERDLNSAVEALSERAGRLGNLFFLGFCFGGRLALYAASRDFDLAGVVSFYSPMKEDHPVPHPRTIADRIHCPVLAIYAGQDHEEVEVSLLRERLSSAGVVHDVKIYESAAHSFFDYELSEYRAESADAWRRVSAFLGLTSGQ